jgi:hypothetical protein
MVNIVNRTSGNAGLSTTVVSFFRFIFFFVCIIPFLFLFFDRPGTTLALLGAAAAAAAAVGMLYTAVHERQQQTFLPSRAE